MSAVLSFPEEEMRLFDAVAGIYIMQRPVADLQQSFGCMQLRILIYS